MYRSNGKVLMNKHFYTLGTCLKYLFENIGRICRVQTIQIQVPFLLPTPATTILKCVSTVVHQKWENMSFEKNKRVISCGSDERKCKAWGDIIKLEIRY